MLVRKFDPETDYPHAVGCWKTQGWPAIPLDLLPKTGVVVESDGVNLAYGWLYLTDSKMTIMEFIVGNPNVDWKLRDEAIHLVINKLIVEAKERGGRSIFSSVNHKRLMDRYKSHGFIQTDVNMTNFIRNLS
jgi:hypothetical protein